MQSNYISFIFIGLIGPLFLTLANWSKNDCDNLVGNKVLKKKIRHSFVNTNDARDRKRKCCWYT